MVKRWIASNANGRDIVYISVFNFSTIRMYDSNLPNLHNYKGLKNLLKSLVNEKATEQRLDFTVKELIKRIKTIENLKQFYLPVYLLDKKGNFFEPAYNIFREQYGEMYVKFKSWIPYSQTSRPNTFVSIVRYHIPFRLRDKNNGNKLKIINRESFESKLINDKLINCYLDNFNVKASYYYFTTNCEKALIMEKSGEIRMVFFIWLWEESMGEFFKHFF